MASTRGERRGGIWFDDLEPRSACAANEAMERYAAGDDQAFSELYDALAPPLIDFLTSELADGTRAEEVLTQTLLNIHGARGRFLAGADVVPWAFAIARRLLLDSARAEARTPTRPAPHFDAPALATRGAGASRGVPRG